MCRLMEWHFHDWIDYDGVANFWILGVRKFFTFTVSKRARMILLSVKSKLFFIQFKKWVSSF